MNLVPPQDPPDLQREHSQRAIRAQYSIALSADLCTRVGVWALSQPPPAVKLYHIVHVDRLASIVQSGLLFCDSAMVANPLAGTTIGMSTIKQRRLRNRLTSHPGLNVGDCVPFYFCPRSVMLYLLYMGNHPDLTYRGGQDPIVHLEFNLPAVVQWANTNGLRWAFTLGNAGASFFEDRSDLAQLNEINWDAVGARDFRDSDIKEGKQAEFLVERNVPWELVETVGIHRATPQAAVHAAIQLKAHRPAVEVRNEWYY